MRKPQHIEKRNIINAALFGLDFKLIIQLIETRINKRANKSCCSDIQKTFPIETKFKINKEITKIWKKLICKFKLSMRTNNTLNNNMEFTKCIVILKR
ncbi:MAG TPA: hypothetical protein VIL99_08075 [Ignavibacteria bacterium]